MDVASVVVVVAISKLVVYVALVCIALINITEKS